jgi:hypothetical protein
MASHQVGKLPRRMIACSVPVACTPHQVIHTGHMIFCDSTLPDPSMLNEYRVLTGS